MEPSVILWHDPSSVRFPAACAECGAPPSNGYRLVGRHLDARVPLCPVCDSRKSRGMALWIAGTLAGTPIGVLLLGIFLELVVPFPAEHGPRARLGAVFAIVLLAAGALALFVLLRRSAALYHRLRSPVFLLDEKDGVLLAFRNARFVEATRALMAGAQSGYREAPPAAFVAPRLPPYWPAVLTSAWGLGTLAAGVLRYREASAGRGTVRSIEIIAYELAGAPGIAVLYILIAAILVAGGALWFRSVQRTRAEILG